MEQALAVAQALRYAEEFRRVHAEERAQRRRAEDAAARLRDAYSSTVLALSAALDLRDDATGGHAERVRRTAMRLAREVAPELAANPQLEYGFALHDIGKIGIPDAILLKPGPLDETETEVIRAHPMLGERILDGIPHLSGLAREVVGCHHERWDGAGYPRRLAGDEIPLSARIFAVADAFDAMTNDRPYRRACPFREAVAEIARAAGSQFDPCVADAFVAGAPDLREGA